MASSEESTPRRRLSTFKFTVIAQSVGLMISLGCAGIIVFAHYYVVSSRGTNVLLAVSAFIVFPVVLALPTAVCASLLMMNAKCRRFAANLMVVCILFPVLFWFAVRIGLEIRHSAFVDLARRSQPLVQAIIDYETDHGSPPAQLADLIPQYLSHIPAIGIGAYPEYIYEVSTPSVTQWTFFPNEPWALWVSTPTEILDFDMFIYLPSQNYHAWGQWFGSGNTIEKIGDWAYVHE
jgi:hypothetical protein